MKNICLILMVWTLFLYGWDDTADMEQGGYEEPKKSGTIMLPKERPSGLKPLKYRGYLRIGRTIPINFTAIARL